MSELPKTVDQLAKEEALLSKIRLCWHAQQGLCNPPNGRRCNFAHFLRYLSVPEEKYGNWSKVWQQGEVDMRFWESYHPNKQSQQRFSWQFLWKIKWRPEHIPNWAWGHALDLGLLKKEEVPLTFLRILIGRNCSQFGTKARPMAAQPWQ